MARRSTLKASDADREQVAERLREATAEGRLLAEELEERLGAVFRARTYGELDATVADLPNPAPRRTRRSPVVVPLRNPLAVAVAIPVILAIVALVILLITGVVAAWLVWMAVGWWFFGHKHRIYYARDGRYLHGGHRHWQASGDSTQRRSGFWV